MTSNDRRLGFTALTLIRLAALAGEVTLRVVPRHGAVVRVTLKRAGMPAVRDLEEKGSLTMVTKLTTHKVYSYTVSEQRHAFRAHFRI